MLGVFVSPQTFLTGFTTAHMPGLEAYLAATNQTDFLESWQAAKDEGLSDGECLCSFYAKLCYASLVLGKNNNLTRVRDIPSNLENVLDVGHSSVLGHATLNFVTTSCSRILTHELVRNHVGTEFSQTSGRYVRLDKINLVHDSILDDCKDLLTGAVTNDEDTIYLIECRKGLRVPAPAFPQAAANYCLGNFLVGPGGANPRDARWVPNDKLPFDKKKKLTSAIRRIAPNGQSNEIGWSINLRALRHVIQMRTGRHAEWEIRLVFNQVYDLVAEKFPKIFCDAKIEDVDGLKEISGMRTQPYQLTPEQALKQVSIEQLKAELAARGG
jgi:thymidylate synthase (FAD)